MSENIERDCTAEDELFSWILVTYKEGDFIPEYLVRKKASEIYEKIYNVENKYLNKDSKLWFGKFIKQYGFERCDRIGIQGLKVGRSDELWLRAELSKPETKPEEKPKKPVKPKSSSSLKPKKRRYNCKQKLTYLDKGTQYCYSPNNSLKKKKQTENSTPTSKVRDKELTTPCLTLEKEVIETPDSPEDWSFDPSETDTAESECALSPSRSSTFTSPTPPGQAGDNDNNSNSDDNKDNILLFEENPDTGMPLDVATQVYDNLIPKTETPDEPLPTSRLVNPDLNISTLLENKRSDIADTDLENFKQKPLHIYREPKKTNLIEGDMNHAVQNNALNGPNKYLATSNILSDPVFPSASKITIPKIHTRTPTMRVVRKAEVQPASEPSTNKTVLPTTSINYPGTSQSKLISSRHKYTATVKSVNQRSKTRSKVTTDNTKTDQNGRLVPYIDERYKIIVETWPEIKTHLVKVDEDITSWAQIQHFRNRCEKKVDALHKKLQEKCKDGEEDWDDDVATFAANVRARMRKVDFMQRCMAQKLMKDVLYLAKTKQLGINTSINA